MTTLQHKIDFAALLRVKNANPNGDPLNGNRPRTDYDGLGEITDVCLKRKIRDRLQEQGCAIFVQPDDRKVDEAKSLRSRAEAVLGNKLGSSETAKLACKEWFDVRAFGQLLRLSPTKRERGKMRMMMETQAFLSAFVVLFQCNLLSVSSLSALRVLRSQRV